jgi:prefoldin subunit 5
MTNIYDAIKEKENQIAIFQAQISGLQAEIEALRVAARILEGGSANVSDAARPVAVQTVPAANGGDKTKRVWP